MAKGSSRRIAVVGLGYVGLPNAVASGKRGSVIGFDIDRAKIEDLSQGNDRTGEVSGDDLRHAKVEFTADPTDLKKADFIIVAVPTLVGEPC